MLRNPKHLQILQLFMRNNFCNSFLLYTYWNHQCNNWCNSRNPIVARGPARLYLKVPSGRRSQKADRTASKILCKPNHYCKVVTLVAQDEASHYRDCHILWLPMQFSTNHYANPHSMMVSKNYVNCKIGTTDLGNRWGRTPSSLHNIMAILAAERRFMTSWIANLYGVSIAIPHDIMAIPLARE